MCPGKVIICGILPYLSPKSHLYQFNFGSPTFANNSFAQRDGYMIFEDFLRERLKIHPPIRKDESLCSIVPVPAMLVRVAGRKRAG